MSEAVTIISPLTRHEQDVMVSGLVADLGQRLTELAPALAKGRYNGSVVRTLLPRLEQAQRDLARILDLARHDL